MHWFWRAALSVTAGAASFGCLAMPFLDPLIWEATGRVGRLIHLSLLVLLPEIISIAIYALLTNLKPIMEGPQTRCRKCGYILRGISEPRCPECGERI